MATQDNSLDDLTPLSDIKSRQSSIADNGKINPSNAPSERTTLLSAHNGLAAIPEIDQKTNGEVGNIYLGVRCKPGISFWNFMVIPSLTFFGLVVLESYID